MTDEQTTTTYAEYPEGSNGYWYVRRGPGARPLATVWSPDAEKGAKLYAAAEELLAACEHIEQYCGDTISGRVDGPEDREWYLRGYHEMMEAARAALTKAGKDT